jgi:hypothetical protein
MKNADLRHCAKCRQLRITFWDEIISFLSIPFRPPFSFFRKKEEEYLSKW